MSSRKMIVGFLVGLSAAVAACGAQPSSSTPRIGNTGGTSSTGNGGTGTGGTSSGTTAGTTGLAGTTSTTTGGTSDGVSGSTSVAGTTSTGGTVAMADPCVPLDSLKALPMAVDGPFIPGGYFFDPAVPDNANGITHAACDTRPDAATHYGSCHKWSFLPTSFGMGMDPVSKVPETYGGVFWLAGSATNWGTAAGINVAPGAMTVKFRAWGASGGEVVTFSVGGVTGTTCLDSVNFGTTGGMMITLTTTPTDYVFNLQMQTYPKGVIGAFSWSTINQSLTVPVVFNVDDIRWTADAT
jgi:hypothetical protein